jgi:hypothetical protein
MSKPRYGYMCAVDFYHELGEAAGGNMIYPSKKSAIKHSPCVKSCGLLKVEVVEVRKVLPSTFDDAKSSEEWDKYYKSQEYQTYLLERMDAVREQLNYLNNLYEKSKEGSDV